MREKIYRENRLSMSDAPDPFPAIRLGTVETGVPVATNRSDCQARPGEQSENGPGPGASCLPAGRQESRRKSLNECE